MILCTQGCEISEDAALPVSRSLLPEPAWLAVSYPGVHMQPALAESFILKTPLSIPEAGEHLNKAAKSAIARVELTRGRPGAPVTSCGTGLASEIAACGEEVAGPGALGVVGGRGGRGLPCWAAPGSWGSGVLEGGGGSMQSEDCRAGASFVSVIPTDCMSRFHIMSSTWHSSYLSGTDCLLHSLKIPEGITCIEAELARLLLLCMSSGGTSTPLRRQSSRSILQLASDSCTGAHAFHQQRTLTVIGNHLAIVLKSPQYSSCGTSSVPLSLVMRVQLNIGTEDMAVQATVLQR